MNPTKRNLEKIAAIISIVLGALLTLGSLAILAACNDPEMLKDLLGVSGGGQIPQDVIDALKVSTIIVLLLSVAIIVLGSLLAKSPLKHGVIRKRLGLQIALAVLLGLTALFELRGGSLIYAILFAAPLVLLIISMCQKHPGIAVVTTEETVTATIDEPRE